MKSRLFATAFVRHFNNIMMLTCDTMFDDRTRRVDNGTEHLSLAVAIVRKLLYGDRRENHRTTAVTSLQVNFNVHVCEYRMY